MKDLSNFLILAYNEFNMIITPKKATDKKRYYLMDIPTNKILYKSCNFTEVAKMNETLSNILRKKPIIKKFKKKGDSK